MLKEHLLGDRLDCCRIWTAATFESGTTLSSPPRRWGGKRVGRSRL